MARASTTSINVLPSEAEELGFIYNENSWSDTTDFVEIGTATVDVNASNLRVATVTTNVYTQRIAIDRVSNLEKYKITADVRILNTPTSTTYGLGLGRYSTTINQKNNSVANLGLTSVLGNRVAYVITGGSDTFVEQFNSATKNGELLTFAVGDLIRFTFEQDVDKIKVSVFNLSLNEEEVQPLFYYYNPVVSAITEYIANMGRYSIYCYGGQYDIESLSVYSKEYKNAKLLCIGDSKTQGYIGSSFQTRFTGLLEKKYSEIVTLAGGNETSADTLTNIAEVISLSPKKVLLNIGSNDKRNGVLLAAWEANYDSITAQLESAGIEVYHLLMLNETVLTFTDYNSHITSTYAAGRIVNAGTITLNADGVHPSNVGHKEIYNAIVSQIGSQIV